MEVKIIKTKDFYDTMVKWWEGQDFPAVSPSLMPENTFVCYNDEGLPVYSCCFYNTDSNLCWLAWQIANPEVSKDQKSGGLKELFREIEKYAAYVGYHVVFTTSHTPSVEAKLTERGFKVGDTGVNHYIKIL